MNKLWDLPVRICHLLIVLGVIAAWVTAEFDMIAWHERNGVLLLGVVVFRILWGFTGSTSARFSHFLRGPSAVIAYLKNWKSQPRWAGHNPVGGWSVVLLLGLLLIQAATGLFTWTDDYFTADFEAFSGPLAHLVSQDTAKEIAEIHGDVIFKFILLFAVIHILAIAAYRLFKTQNLVTPMVTGMAPVDTSSYTWGSWRRLLLSLGVAFAVMWRIYTL